MISKPIAVSEIHLSDEEISAAVEVLKSGNLREGKKVKEFEEAFAAKAGVKHAIAASSGTSALHLSYLTILKPGDEVLVPAFTFIATASMVTMAGGKPVFCDVDAQTWTISAAEIEKRITPKTRAIAGVHLFGNACEIDEILKIARKHQLKVIWDAAQSLGTTYEGKDIAQYPDLVCFSFYPGKNMTTCEGGMVATNDDAAAARIRLLKNHGQSEKYHHSIVGLNYRMTEVEAVIGNGQLSKLDWFLERRRQLGERYKEAFLSVPEAAFQKTTTGAGHSYNYFSILLDFDALGFSRETLMKSLQEKGVQTAIHYPKPLHTQPCFDGEGAEKLPVAEALSSRILALPMHPYMKDEDADFVAELIKKNLTRNRNPAMAR
jgi:perosamine synthetase